MALTNPGSEPSSLSRGLIIPWSNVDFTHRAFRNPLRLPKLAVLGTPGERLSPERRECGLVTANKTGFGTSYTSASNVWFTLQNGRLSEVYYPRIDTPSVRNLDFIVTDGQSFAVRAQDGSTSLTRLVNLGHPADQKEAADDRADNPTSLTYQIVNRDREDHWRLTTTFVTDPVVRVCLSTSNLPR